MARKKSKQDPADRTEFLLSADKWEKFQAALDAPERDLPRLHALLDPIQTSLAECLEELARAARRHLADPGNPAWRDRLSTAAADAFALLHDEARPQRVITVPELLEGDPVVRVGTDPDEAAIPYYNRRMIPEDQAAIDSSANREALLKILSLGEREVEAGLVEPAAVVFKQKRFTTMPDDPIKDGIRAHIRKNHGKLIPFNSEALWGCPVRVVRPLLVEAWMGGWGDGWYESNPGALYLLGSAPYPRNPLCIQFWCGPEPLAVYRPEHGRSGGLVLLSDLGCFEDLTPIISRIEAAFPDQAEAWRWIQAPCEALGGETPRRLLGTAEGHKQIEIGLARI